MSFRGLAILAVLVPGIALTGCQSRVSAPNGEAAGAGKAAATAQSTEPTATETPPAPAEPVPPAEAPVAESPAIATLPPAPQPPPEPVIDDNPDRLLGLERSEVRALLGTPAQIRREATAEIWQYMGASCVFDVFLYETGGGASVEYVEARDGEGRPIEARACLNGLLRARLPG